MTPSDLAALIAGGKRLAASGAHREAEAVLRAALTIDVEEVEALLWLGAIVADPAEALALIGRAYTIEPTNERAKAGLAWARARQDDRAGLAATPTIAQPLAPEVLGPRPLEVNDANRPATQPLPVAIAAELVRPIQQQVAAARLQGLLDQARGALDVADFSEVILAADEAARLDPRSVEALALLGVAYYRLDRPADAERVYRRMLAIQPDHAEALANLGLLAAEAGRDDDAERSYRRALDVDPALDEVRLALADLLAAQGRTDAAVAEWRSASDRNPAIAEFQVKIGDALALADRYEEAAAAYARAVDRHGDDPSLRLRLGRVLHAAGRTGAALEQFREACRGPHAPVESFIELAAALMEIGRLEEARDALDQGLALSPEDPAALDLLARLQPQRRVPASWDRAPARRPERGPQVIGPARGILDRFRLQ
ncbi:MAG: tetratricopeptide repeat protein [Dehalococcoidia bacterium]